MPANIVRALQSFIGQTGKDTHYITDGDLFDASDPLVKKHPKLFGPVELRASSPTIEQATAAPGEKRRITIRRKAKPAKAKAAPKPEPVPEPEPEPTPEPEPQPEQDPFYSFPKEG